MIERGGGSEAVTEASRERKEKEKKRVEMI